MKIDFVNTAEQITYNINNGYDINNYFKTLQDQVKP